MSEIIACSIIIVSLKKELEMNITFKKERVDFSDEQLRGLKREVLNEIDSIKKERTKRIIRHEVDENTMRPEYDFSKGVREVTAKRYALGTNVVVLDPDVVRLFPNATAVNEALRALGGGYPASPTV